VDFQVIDESQVAASRAGLASFCGTNLLLKRLPRVVPQRPPKGQYVRPSFMERHLAQRWLDLADQAAANRGA
jgi:hypothetical protein